MGFREDTEERETNWTPYQARPVVVQVNGNRIAGVVYEVNLDDGYVDFKPSLVPSGDYVRREDDVPTRLFLVAGLSVVIRPLQEGDLEKEIVDHKAQVDKEKSKK